MQKVNAGDIEGAYEYFGHWRSAGKKILKGLIKRRFAELFVFADRTLDPGDDRIPSEQWGLSPMPLTDENWVMLDKVWRREAVGIFMEYKGFKPVVWTNVKLIPHFVQPNVFVRLTYNGESLPPQALYSSPVLSHVTFTTSTPGWPTELGRFSFDYQQEDAVINFVESNGVSLTNGQELFPLIPLGALWGKNPIQQMAVVFPQIDETGCTVVCVRAKAAPNWGKLWPKNRPQPPSLHLWIKQNGLKITHNGRSWESDDSETTQHPFCKVHWSVAIAQ